MPTTPAQQAHYQKNRQKYIHQAQERRLAFRAFVQSEKSKPCADCGNSYPYYVMHFDHVPERGNKIENISRLMLRGSMDSLVKEIAKCDLVCSNCHAFRTHHRTLLH